MLHCFRIKRNLKIRKGYLLHRAFSKLTVQLQQELSATRSKREAAECYVSLSVELKMQDLI